MKEEKASEKWWNSKCENLSHNEWFFPADDKQLYDQLLSLEAKIEVLKSIIDMTDLDNFEAEYNKLKEQHNL